MRDESGDHTAQSAFHSCHHDDHTRALQALPFRQESMETGDTHVVETIDVVAHELGGDGGFFGHRQIRRAGARNENRALATGNHPL